MDKVLYNGIIRTMDPDLPLAEAVVIRDGVILTVVDGQIKYKNEDILPGQRDKV